MPTPFHEVYELFLSQVSDYSLAEMETLSLEENMYKWMTMAIPSFTMCRQDLTQQDTVNKTFLVELTSIEKSILAVYMLIEYLKTQTITTENLRHVLNSKDYNTYSPANQINALVNVRKELLAEASTLLSRYSWGKKGLTEGWNK